MPLGVWLCEELCRSLAKVVDDGLDLSLLLLILDTAQIHIVWGGVVSSYGFYIHTGRCMVPS